MVEFMNWTELDTWIVVTGVLCAMSCALLGNFLVLRRMSMMGDAISHAVLPGIAAAFLLTGSRDSLTMFAGAAIVGVLTALFTQWINSFGQVEESASMGVVFTTLFAIGLIMIVRAADAVDLDPGCLLYGAIELVPLDTRALWGMEVPRAVINLGCVLTINVIFTVAFYKELKISTFDPALATTLGFNANLMHYLLMTLVAVTTVAAFEAVGSILVIAMLIVPAAAAHLLTDRLSVMLFLSLVIGGVSAVLGHVGAITIPTWFGFSDTSTAGMIAVMAGGLFAVTLVAAPRHGAVSKLFHRTMLAVRITQEDVLGLLYRLEEMGQPGDRALIPTLLRNVVGAGPVLSHVAVLALRRRGKVVAERAEFRLTPAGRQAAQQLVRSHRLWESYLQKFLHLPADHVHTSAERLEHVTDGSIREQLSATTGNPPTDPHGAPIPPSGES